MCLGTGKINIIKVSALPNLIYRFNRIPIKSSPSYFVSLGKEMPKFIWEVYKRPRIAKSIMKKTKWEVWHYSTSRLTIKLQWPRQCSGKRIYRIERST